jgi:hypothetical protein
MRCAQLDRGTSADADPIAIFSIMNVEPLANLELEGAVGYQLMRSLTTDQSDLIADWSDQGVQTARSPVSLAFSAIGANPDASATFAATSPLHSVSGDSTMTGAPTSGQGGVLGLYTFDADGVVHLHRIEFSAYSTYPNGVAVLRPGIAGAPANTVQAYHNIDYDVRFELAIDSRAGPDAQWPKHL